VADGRDAVALYRRARAGGAPFAAVVLDLTIPGGMGGEQTMAELRRLDPEVRAIAASGYANDPVMAHRERYGFKAALPKPFTRADLGKALQEAIG